jgi:hypothetical protein
MKRPEVAEGRDPRNESLIADARRKAVGRGLPFYFTCNMAEIVLFSVGVRPGELDREEAAYELAPITNSRQVLANWDNIALAWSGFLDDLERRLEIVSSVRPPVTAGDVLLLRRAIYDVAEEAIDRVIRRVADEPVLADEARREAAETFGFNVSLNSRYAAQFRDDLLQILRLGVFVVAQKLVLYRSLAESGPLRSAPFQLDPLSVPRHSTDPSSVRASLDQATAHAISRSGDYETAFLLTPHADLVFLPPEGMDESDACRAGEVWGQLLDAIESASWTAINENLVGMLYEVIVDPVYRHELGQHYTREDVVDLLTTFAIREAGDVVMDPASGGGSFSRAAYRRKRMLGEAHESALATTWAFEISAFAAELTTISLATVETAEPAAYPRVLLMDFFDTRPGLRTELEIPGISGTLSIPGEFDAVIGNPPYISYRHQHNQAKVLNALATAPETVAFPRFSGKSDEYVFFIAHATSFIKPGGRLSFVVSSAMLFADYGIPLIRFLARHYKIVAVIDSISERWFVDADTNTILLLLEREEDMDARADNEMRFVRFRHPLARLLPEPTSLERRGSLEDLIADLVASPAGGDDPRFSVTIVRQGPEGGLTSSTAASDDESSLLTEIEPESTEGDGDD